MDGYRQSWERVPEGPKPERSPMDDYTPTEGEVIGYYVAGREAQTDGNEDARAEEFTRWLAARDAVRDREVAERAWDRCRAASGVTTGALNGYEVRWVPDLVNPYRLAPSSPVGEETGQ